MRRALRALVRAGRRGSASLRREPLLWAAGSLVVLIAAVTILSQGQASPRPPLGNSYARDLTREVAAARAAIAQQDLSERGAAAQAPAAAPSRPATAPVSAPALQAVWPLSGRVALGYGWVFDRVGGYWYYHTGWEIAATPGATVQAALPGDVVGVEREPSGQFTVVVRSPNGVVATYSGLASTSLASGGTVRQGQAVGQVPGSGGRLGFSVTRGGQPVNPSSILPSAPTGALRQS